MPFDIKVTRQGLVKALPSDSTCVLKAKPSKLYIERCKDGILFISLPIGSLFKLMIMTLSIFMLIQLIPEATDKKKQKHTSQPRYH